MLHRMLGWFALSTAIAVTPLAAQEPPPATRVAVIKLGDIFQNYAKAKEGKQALEAALAPYKLLADKLRDETNRLQQVVADLKADPVDKDVAGKKLVALRRQMEDLNTEAQKVAGKKAEHFLIGIYTDIEAAIERYADAHNIDLVLAFGEPAKEDRLKYANLTRKLSAADQGGVVPLFVRPRIDITQGVLKTLNDAYSAKK